MIESDYPPSMEEEVENARKLKASRKIEITVHEYVELKTSASHWFYSFWLLVGVFIALILSK